MNNRSQNLPRILKIATLTTITFTFAGALGAQEIRPNLHHVHPWHPVSNVSPGSSIQIHQPLAFPPPLNPTTWINIGPAPITIKTEATPDAGRIDGIAAHPTDPNTIYVAAAGGGVWKTTNGGTTWIPLTDTQKTTATGAIAMAPSNSSVLYAGTGEADSGGNFGRGVLVSTDGGATWTLQTNGGLFDRREVSEIAIDPNNAKVAYVATSSCCATNTNFNDDAIFKTTDGGVTWTDTTTSTTKVVDGWSSVRIDPTTPTTVYAAAGYPFGRALNGVYKSTDGGTTWNKLTDSKLPSGIAAGRIVVAVSKSNSKVVYVSAAGTGKTGSTPSGSLYKFLRSDDGGATFTDLTATTPNYMTTQGNFDTTLIVDPANSAIVYAGGSTDAKSLIRSTDSGATWTDISGGSNGFMGPHVDHHAAAFDANGKFLDGDDGGIFRYDPAAKPTPTWTALNGNLSTATLNSIAIDPIDVKIALAGSQDNGTVRFSGSLDWPEVDGGDGGTVRFSQQNPSRVYHQFPVYPDSFFSRSDDTGLNWTGRTSGITDNNGDSQNFYAPFAVDPNDGNRVIFGARHVWETTNGGDTWTRLGTFDFLGQNVDSLDVSASHPNTIYASANGHTFLTTDKGVTWTQRDLPVSGKVASIKIFPAQNLRAVAVISEFTTGGNVFHTIDGGKTWSNITGNLPNLPVWSVQFHGNSIKTLYVGADDGVYKTTDQGATWSRFGSGFPNAQVFDIQLDTALGVLAAGTYGRGAWEIKLPPPTNTTVSAVSGSVGELVTLKADVTPSGVPGKVVFEVNGTVVGTATYDKATGRAELPYVITLAAGKYQITADFTSSNEALGGNSGGVNELTVKPATTKTTVSRVSGKAGDLVTLLADVTPAGVSGAVKFLINGSPIPGTATYDKGTGHAEQGYIITVPAGKHQITADFTSSNPALGGNSTGVNELIVSP